MTDDQLKEYLPSYGDRLAVFGYCRRNENSVSRRKCVSQGGRVRFADGRGGGSLEMGDCRWNEREKTGGNTANISIKKQ